MHYQYKIAKAAELGEVTDPVGVIYGMEAIMHIAPFQPHFSPQLTPI